MPAINYQPLTTNQLLTMIIKTKGIIIRTKKYSESSIIADIYTEEKGLRSYIVSGVRAKKSKFPPGLLQVMSLVDMVAYHRDEKSLTRIKEVRAAHVYQRLPFETARRSVGIFMAEITRKTIKESEENKELFDFLFDSFVLLDETEHSVANLHLSFMVNLSSYLGFMPGGERTADTPFFDLKEGNFVPYGFEHTYFLPEDLSAILNKLLLFPPERAHEIPVSRGQRKLLVGHLLDYYGLHIENFPKINSHGILEEIFGSGDGA